MAEARLDGGGFSDLVGIEYLETSAEEASGRVEVTDRVLQPYGVVHGGLYATLAESVCSRATAYALAAERMAALGQSNQVSFLRPITDGHVNASATVRHRGRTTWVWDCELSDDDGRLCALARLTIAVRPGPS